MVGRDYAARLAALEERLAELTEVEEARQAVKCYALLGALAAPELQEAVDLWGDQPSA